MIPSLFPYDYYADAFNYFLKLITVHPVSTINQSRLRKLNTSSIPVVPLWDAISLLSERTVLTRHSVMDSRP